MVPSIKRPSGYTSIIADRFSPREQMSIGRHWTKPALARFALSDRQMQSGLVESDDPAVCAGPEAPARG